MIRLPFIESIRRFFGHKDYPDEADDPRTIVCQYSTPGSAKNRRAAKKKAKSA